MAIDYSVCDYENTLEFQDNEENFGNLDEQRQIASENKNIFTELACNARYRAIFHDCKQNNINKFAV